MLINIKIAPISFYFLLFFLTWLLNTFNYTFGLFAFMLDNTVIDLVGNPTSFQKIVPPFYLTYL